MQVENILHCAIVDDEPLPIELLEDYIRRTPGLRLLTAVRNPLQLLQFVERHPVQVVFLDIQMPELMGFQVARLLRGKSEVVVTTAFPQYALDGFEHDVADYLLKPFSFDRFLAAISKCKKRISANEQRSTTEAEHFFVKSGSRLLKIFLDDIVYLEAMRDYVAIHLLTEKILTLQSLASFEEQLPDRFVRIHRSYIINADKLCYIEGNTISLGRTILPVGEKYQSRVARLAT